MNHIIFIIYQILCILTRFKRILYDPIDIPKLVNNNNKYDTTKTISICTWNIQCLFIYMNNKYTKLNNIIKHIKSINKDIICLQEVFDDFSKQYIIENLKFVYPNYLLGTRKKKYILGEDSGLLVLSKYKINYLNEFVLDGGIFPDTLSNKSALFFKIKNIIFCNTHLQSNDIIESNVSKLQIKKILNCYKNIILVGDLNNDTIYNFINTKNINYNITALHDNKILDYIVSNNDYYNIISNTHYIDIKNTTDHFPVVGTIYLE